MIGALIGAGLSLAGSIAGGIKSAKAAREQQKQIDEQRARNEAYYNKNYYQDYMDRSDVQAAMERVRSTMQRSNRMAQQQAAVTGATPESVIAQQQANNEAVVNAAQAIQAGDAANKARVEENYLNREASIDNQQMQQQQMTEQGTANFAQSALQSAGMIANSAIGGNTKPSASQVQDFGAKKAAENLKKLETNFTFPK